MKTQASICALLLSVSLLSAQTEEKPVTVRVKKIEKINGVEKITDTSYTVKGPVSIHEMDGLNIKECETVKNGKPHKMVIVTDEISGNGVELNTLGKEELMDDQIQRALKAAGVDEKNAEGSNMVTITMDSQNKGEKNGDKVVKYIIIKKVKVVDASVEEKQNMDKQTGISDNKLSIEKMNFYPNPNNGKFHLNFNLSNKGTTEINIFNMEGKSIYNEELKDFSGNYDKEIDISSNPKGSYFVKVKQGEHAQLKKIVME